jgi:peptidoglycan/xylan/chitin deacetylase (PgdA/CDA1 family)
MTGNRSAILTYHSLDDTGSVISTPPALFRKQMEYLAACNIPVVPLGQALRQPGSVAITFDDGYCNFLDEALPVLDRHRFPATVFIVAEYCGRKNNWPTQSPGRVPELPLMSWSELLALPTIAALGAHTLTHPNLARLTIPECERELRDCQSQMEQRLARPVRWLAYPYGGSSPEVRSLAARYFDLAVSTSLRFLPPHADCLDLPRIDAYYLRGRFPIESLFTQPGGWYIQMRNWIRKARS